MENPKTTIQNKEDVISQEEKPKRKRVKKEVNENDQKYDWIWKRKFKL